MFIRSYLTLIYKESLHLLILLQLVIISPLMFTGSVASNIHSLNYNL